jgi:hypothetical protein
VNPQSETVTDLTNSDRAFVAAFSLIVQRSVAIETLKNDTTHGGLLLLPQEIN